MMFMFMAVLLGLSLVPDAARAAKRCAAEPGSIVRSTMGPGSASRHFVLRARPGHESRQTRVISNLGFWPLP